jgi:hypothetical protein
MKIDIGPYKNWVGPYQIAEKILFWIPKYDEKNSFEYTKAYDKYVHPFGEWLAEDKNGNDSWLTKFCQWIESKRKRKVKIRIDHYDTWSMDSTLAPIILPMLKQLKATKHGSGYVELEDVPENLRYTQTEDYDAQQVFEFYNDDTSKQKLHCDVHTRYEWLLDELIWTFEQLSDEDSEKEFWIEHGEIDFDKYPEDEGKTTKPLRWKKEAIVDWDGLRAHQERVSNGLKLFGKYYQTLWD